MLTKNNVIISSTRPQWTMPCQITSKMTVCSTDYSGWQKKKSLELCITGLCKRTPLVTHGFQWWRHQIETFSILLAICVGNSPVTGEFPSQRSVTWSFDVFFDLRLNKRLSKQLRGLWFETPSRSLWHHCNALRRGQWCRKYLHAPTSSWNINWKLCYTWNKLDKLLCIVIEYIFLIFFMFDDFFFFISYFHHWNFYVPIVFQGNVNINFPAISFLETSQVVEISS